MKLLYLGTLIINSSDISKHVWDVSWYRLWALSDSSHITQFWVKQKLGQVWIFLSLVREGMQSAVIESIVLLIFFCVSRSSLADLMSRPVQLCRSRWRCRGFSGDNSSYSTRKSAVYTSRTLKTFGWRSKDSLGALRLWNVNAAEAQKYLFV